ncbi:MAG TPA: peptidylprolyl isomerase, partial [Geobacteraceae bacterium]|nr:peptidylprolyl isomerase [Geobacteraceae bacterium]
MFRRLLYAALILLALGCTVASAAEKNPVVLVETSMGNVKIELFAKDAPISVKNFLAYVHNGYYKGTIFHRVIPGFMAQGGGLTAELQPKPGDLPAIKNEAGNGLKNDRGTVAMARTGMVDSATSQFFVNVVNNDFLNHRDNSPGGYGYAVFGKVVEGMDVVDKMVAAPQTRKNAVFQNVPNTPIVIKD